MSKENSKLILITGVNGIVGSAVSNKFKSAGWKVIGVDKKSEQEFKEGQFMDAYMTCDLRSRANFNAVVNEIEKDYGVIEALFTSPEGLIGESFEKTDIKTWKESLDTWLRESINACAAVAPSMVKRKSGRIIVLSPDYSQTDSGYILDATAAGTLHGFVKSFGVELAEHNVMINALFANVPYDLDAITSTARYFAERDDYVTAQVISVAGQE